MISKNLVQVNKIKIVANCLKMLLADTFMDVLLFRLPNQL